MPSSRPQSGGHQGPHHGHGRGDLLVASATANDVITDDSASATIDGGSAARATLVEASDLFFTLTDGQLTTPNSTYTLKNLKNVALTLAGPLSARGGGHVDLGGYSGAATVVSQGAVRTDFNLGTGPANVIMNLTLTKAIGIGPRLKRPAAPNAVTNAVNAAQSGGIRPGECSAPAAAAAPAAPSTPTGAPRPDDIEFDASDATLALIALSAKMRMDQIEVEPAEIELLGEAGPVPFGLAGGLGDLAGLAFGHIGAHGNLLSGRCLPRAWCVRSRVAPVDALVCSRVRG